MPNEVSSDLWSRLADGDAQALSEATALLYRDLRAAARSEMRRERRDHTLQPTSLVHEMLIRMRASASLSVEGTGHFLNIAREVMRHVLVDHAKAKCTLKRNRLRADVALEKLPLSVPAEQTGTEWKLALRRLKSHSPDRARVIQLRYLFGHTWDEIAARMQITISQARYLEREALGWFRAHSQ